MKVLRSNNDSDTVVLTGVVTAGRIEAAKVAEIRRRLDISQGVLAKLLNCTLSRVQAWEQGRVEYVGNGDAMLLHYLETNGYQAYVTAFGLAE